jgi:hypothetical protein
MHIHREIHGGVTHLSGSVGSSEKDINGSIMAGTLGRFGTLVAGVCEAGPVTSAAVRGEGRQTPGRADHDSLGHIIQQSLRTAAESESPTSEPNLIGSCGRRSFVCSKPAPRADPDTVGSRNKRWFGAAIDSQSKFYQGRQRLLKSRRRK